MTAKRETELTHHLRTGALLTACGRVPKIEVAFFTSDYKLVTCLGCRYAALRATDGSEVPAA